VVLEKSQQLIEFAVIDQDDSEAIVCSAQLTRDIDDNPVGLTEFEKILAPKKTIFFSGLFEPIALAEDKAEEFEGLWEEMKPKILHRTMGL
jgi:Ca2+-dependent lipid-binding protein